MNLRYGLYVKIFFSFLLILLVTEAAIFALYRFSVPPQAHFHRFARAQSLVIQELIKEQMRLNPLSSPADNPLLVRFVEDLSDAFQAKVWISDRTGVPVVRSSPDPLPSLSSWHVIPLKDFTLVKGQGDRGEVLVVKVPILIRGGFSGDLNILFERNRADRMERVFLPGLAGIGLIIALLILPVTRLITNPVNRLKESALRIAKGDLSHRVTETGSDEIGELGESFNSMAEKIEEMIRNQRELSARISHEIRSPLARIRIAAELMRDRMGEKEEDAGKRVDSYLDSIESEVEELDLLIEKILRLSRAEMIGDSVILAPLWVGPLLQQLTERMLTTLQKKGIRLQQKISPSLPPLLADQETLRSAFLALLDNALKFTPSGGEILLDLRQEGGNLLFLLENDFTGKAPPDPERLFELFYRPEGTEASGTGLGLAIARKIVERHGGSIRVLPDEKRFRIEIRLPLRPIPGQEKIVDESQRA